ncbi:hypothetical protein DFS34DRAFT_632670 [Phlyctochytrium arcticum]|nr:hypothetical protein DFS34DRAFT_632670 [Phlyctochytrium arcticum]
MRFTSTIIATLLFAGIASSAPAAAPAGCPGAPAPAPAPNAPAAPKTPTGFNAALIPATEVAPGNPACQGDSVGPINGVRIPCRCPPTDAELAATVQQQHPNIPMGTDLDSTLQRFQLTLASLQTLKCPGAATKLVPKLQKLGQLKATGQAVPDSEVANVIKATGDLFSPKLVAGAGPGFNGQQQG